MSTFYLDYKLGDDANDGSAFGGGTAWKTMTLGATAARIAPGDIIKVAKSPAPTSIGDALWTTAERTLVQKSIESSTADSPIVITITGHGYSTDDIVQIIGHTINTNANGNWIITVIDENSFSLNDSIGFDIGGWDGTAQKINSKVIVLATSLTANIDTCETAWIPSVNVVDLDSTNPKEGLLCRQFNIDSPLESGLVAYKTLNASTDFSGYNQISFWVNGIIGDGDFTLDLCSDTDGTVSVNSIPIPFSGANQWQIVTVDTGAALGSAIQSVSINAISNPGTTIIIDNIIACKNPTSADSLTLSSLISKNSLEQGGDEGWYGIKSINGRIVILDMTTDLSVLDTNYNRYYSGTTETVTTYKRETIKTIPTTTATSDIVQQIMSSGTVGNNIEFQGGYDTGTGLQTGETFFDGQNGYGYGIYLEGKSYITFNHFSGCRYYSFFVLGSSSSYNDITSSNVNNNTMGVYLDSSPYNTINISNANNCSTGVLIVSSDNTLTISNANNNSINGVRIAATYNNTLDITNANNNLFGVLIESSYNNTLDITNTKYNLDSGVDIEYSYNNIITSITNANYNGYGVKFNRSYNNIITSITNANYNLNSGIYFLYSDVNIITTISNINNNAEGFNLNFSSNNTISTISNANYNATNGICFNYNAYSNIIDTITNVTNNGGPGIKFILSYNNNINTISNANDNNYGIFLEYSSENIIKNISTTGSLGNPVCQYGYGKNYIQNAAFAETGALVATDTINFTNSKIFINKLGGTYSKIFTDGGTIESQASTLTNGSGTEWLFTTVTNTNRSLSPNNYPLTLSIAKIAVTANNAVTVTVWCKKGHATDIGARLVCRGGQLAGVATDVYDEKVDDTSEEQLTISFTPTESGVIEIEAWAYYVAGHSTVIFDAMTITQV